MDAVRTAVERLPTRQAYAQELTRLWREAQDRFVAIGEYLMHAKEMLPHGEYEKMVAIDLPFGRAVAHTLRTVALAVQEGRLAKPELPRSYTTAYFLATLEPDHLALARERGLVRHDVPRSSVDAFRRELRHPPLDNNAVELLREQTRLQRQLMAIQARLAEIEHQIHSSQKHVVEGQAETETSLMLMDTDAVRSTQFTSQSHVKQDPIDFQKAKNEDRSNQIAAKSKQRSSRK